MFKFINLNVKFFIIADGFYYAGYSVVNAFLSILITSKITGGRIEIVGFVIAYYMFIRAVLEIPLSRLTSRYSFISKRNLIASSYILYGIFTALLGFSTQIWHLFLIQTIIGFLDALTYPIKWPIFTRLIDKEKEELEWSLEDIFSTLLPAFFTALAGIISSAFGLESAFLLFGSLLIISGVTFLFIRTTKNQNMGVLSDNQISALKKVSQILTKNNIKFQISGGLAAIVYGAKRPLYDIDIDVYKKDITKIQEFFKEYISEDFYHLQDENFDIWLLTLKIDGVPVDISQVEDFYFCSTNSEKVLMSPDLSKSVFIDFDGIKIPVENKDELIKYKKILARETDLADTKQIEK